MADCSGLCNRRLIEAFHWHSLDLIFGVKQYLELYFALLKIFFCTESKWFPKEKCFWHLFIQFMHCFARIYLRNPYANLPSILARTWRWFQGWHSFRFFCSGKNGLQRELLNFETGRTNSLAFLKIRNGNKIFVLIRSFFSFVRSPFSIAKKLNYKTNKV